MLEEKNDKLRQDYARESEETRRRYNAKLKSLEDRLGKLRHKVESMRKVQEEKDEVERLLAEYKELLDVEKREHTVEVSVLERRNITEKDRLRSEMLRKIRETKLHLLAMTEDQLHATTKRTIMENEQMTGELQYQSRQTERILTEHNKLIKENKDLKRRMELHTQAQGMLGERARGFQNKIKKLSRNIPQSSRNLLEEDLKVKPAAI